MEKVFLSLLSCLILSFFSFSQSSANFDITFTSIWNANDHTNIPTNAHWSKLVGATHKTKGTFLKIGALASTGIKNVAELGNNTVFNNEVETEIKNNEADQYINGGNLTSATGNILISNLKVNKEFPLLTLVSMVAPSPDWMIAIDGVSLMEDNGNWKTSAIIDLFAYDAGTDSGSNYGSNNQVTAPFQPISMMNGLPFNGKKIGTLTITLKSPLAINHSSSVNEIRVFPNPVSDGEITISNLERIQINKVELINNLGQVVKSMDNHLNLSTLLLNIHGLPSGIYTLMLSLNDSNGTIISKKLVVK